ncbi:MAG: filamentous hemagglutinin [Bradyrhizobiaceae bacterium PARB1]|nr:MAG: filamentous hemagglutinin [Bradyrhizobiaceae bacterium PARB1]
MPNRSFDLRASRSHSKRRQFVLLAGVCSAAIVAGAPQAAYARALNGGAAGGAASAPNIAADAATQAAAQAAAAARQTQDSLARAARAVQDMQSIQAAARAAAAAAQVSATAPVAVPNGLGAGGLLPDMSRWDGANAPTQAADGKGQTEVNIRQTTQQAILNWQSFNVGARTTLTFDQQGNRSWVALNRVDRDAGPSQILGQIKADGHVYVINQSGIIFGGNSQVNVGSLIASTADIDDTAFRSTGIFSTQTNSVYTPSFKAAGGKVVVESGAVVETRAPTSVTSGGGYVLMIGSEVSNAGSISTPKGQTLLAAGDDFVLRRGFNTNDNPTSTVRGIEIAPKFKANSTSGRVSNSGLVLAQQGDITLAGRSLTQGGILTATTSVNARGTIHLLTSASDAAGNITLDSGSVTAILPELDSTDTALDSKRDGLIEASLVANTLATGVFDNLSRIADRQDQSRVEIVSGNTVTFKGGSYTAAQGGQIAVSATKRIQTDDGARLDVSGVRNVALAMDSNNVKVKVQGEELRDSPLNRDSGMLISNEVWIDVRSLVLLPKGTGGYTADRYYTAGGLLEVGGYLGTRTHTIGEWASVGGTITLFAPEVVAQRGAVFDLSGGSLDYAAGWIRSTNLIGRDGRRYSVDNAPADMDFVNFAGGFRRDHNIQGRVDDRLTEIWTTIFDRGRTSMRWEGAYSVGRDAGRLVLTAPTVLFDADIIADVINGKGQVNRRATGITDGYKVTQNSVAREGTLAMGDYASYGRVDLVDSDIRFGNYAGRSQIGAGDVIADDRRNTAWFDAAHLSAMRLGGIEFGTRRDIAIEAPLTLATAGTLDLTAAVIDFAADVTARSGTINASNRFTPASTPNVTAITRELTTNGKASVTLREGVTLDLRGLWFNGNDGVTTMPELASLNGGKVNLESSFDVTMKTGSVIDVSSGGAMMRGGKTRGGRGGDIALLADAQVQTSNNGVLTLDGELRAFGVSGSGTLRVQSGPAILIGGTEHQTSSVLSAGNQAVTDLVTRQDYVVRAGETMPVDFNYTATKAAAGEVLVGAPQFTSTNGGTLLLKDWTLPTYASAVRLTINYFRPDGSTGSVVYTGATTVVIPAGSRIYYMFNSRASSNNGNTLPTGFVVPQGVFDGGIPISPTLRTIAAGSPALTDSLLPAGTVLPFGTTLLRDVAVQAPMRLDPGVLASGFSNYEVNGHHGVVVGKNVALDVTMPAYRFTAAAMAVPTGASPSAALELWMPPLYPEDPRAGVLTQRNGASITLSSVDVRSGGTIAVSQGAHITVDPGQTIALTGRVAATFIDGKLTAPGGKIVINQDFLETLVGAVNRFNTKAIWIGDNAVLDVSSRAATAVDSSGRTYGWVRDGGTISIGGALDWEASGIAKSSDAFVIVRPGAVLDASGDRAVFDFPTGEGRGATRAAEVASNGGTITLSSHRGVYLDGTMRAAAGGAGAAGGTLAIALESPLYARANLDQAVMIPRELTLVQTAGTSGLASNLKPNERDAALVYGRGRIGVDQIARGQFANVALYSSGLITFEDKVALDLSQSLRFYAGAYGLADNAGKSAQVSLAAPYVRLANVSGDPGTDNNFTMPLVHFGGSYATGNSARASVGLLAVTADLIDIRDLVGFGIRQTIQVPGSSSLSIDRRSFDKVQLTSRGDLRLLRAVDKINLTNESGIMSAGDISLTAAQIYPVTGAKGIILAGSPSAKTGFPAWTLGRELTISRYAGSDPAAPLSAFGSLTLLAPSIEQGGVVRAPLGNLSIGYGVDYTTPGTDVHFLPGSITSVSGAGLVLPYGGTVDDVKYLYDGKELVFADASGVNQVNYKPGITVSGIQIDVQAGALLDLSGGGDLLGAAFVTGRGGSVDVLKTALANANPAYRLSDKNNRVYAIVPGYAGYAPSAPEAGAGDPAIGQQITIPAGVPGLAAATYTLMPSTYATVPGAYRVEIGATNPLLSTVVPVYGATYLAPGIIGTANTGIRNALPNTVLITSGTGVRQHSSYHETSYNDFVLIDAQQRGVLRAPLTSDGKTLDLVFGDGAGMGQKPALSFSGKALFGATPDSLGFAGGASVALTTNDPWSIAELEIMAPGARSNITAGTPGASILSDQINAINAPSLTIQGGTSKLIVRSGAYLTAARVALTSTLLDEFYGTPGGGIVVEQGATIDTVGRGHVGRSADDGYLNQVAMALIVSNDRLNVRVTGAAGSPFEIGTCASGNCSGETRLVSEGSIVIAAPASFEMTDEVSYGTRNLVLATSSINLGENAALEQAAAAGALPPGLTMNQTVLANLLRGNTALNAPAVEALLLSATRSVNVFGSVRLDTTAAGASALKRLVMGTPAIYGYGAAGDTATIATGEFVWASVFADQLSSTIPAVPASGSAAIADRLGNGVLDIVADRIVVGYGVNARPDSTVRVDRTTAGFDALNLRARESVVFEGNNTIGVYQAQGAYVAGKGFDYSGGSLTIASPLITSEAGAVTAIKVGGAISLVRFDGANGAPDYDALGGELRFSGSSALIDTRIALHSGKLTFDITGDIRLGDRSYIDLSGREVTLFDVKKYSWGGDLSLISASGNILQSGGSVIDLSARNNSGGTLDVVATDGTGGQVSLAGTILGGSSGVYDAGGTLAPFDAAEISVKARLLDDFAGLNARLNAGNVTGARSFHVKQGDLVVNDGVKARRVAIYADGGSLTVNGNIDASGFQVGEIRLGARDDLIVNGLLDAHGAGVRVDSYGKVIESPNRAIIDLTSRGGTLQIASGAAFDLRTGTEIAGYGSLSLGTLTLNARRVGGTGGLGGVDSAGDGANDVALSVTGVPVIRGARMVAVNAFRMYDDAPLASAPDVTGNTPQIITQAYLDGIDLQNIAFMTAVQGNTGLSARLAALGNAHLRPGVEVTSNAVTNPGGGLTVLGDIDLSGYRYGPNANRTDAVLRGYGEAGALVIRGAGGLTIHGSINDGFARPQLTPDDNGWILAGYSGPNGNQTNVTPFGQDVVVPVDGLTLDLGTKFAAGAILNYNLPTKGGQLPAGTILAATATLAETLIIPAGTVLAAPVFRADDSVAYPAGTVVSQGLTLDPGIKLGAGIRLPSQVTVGPMVWPKGVPLPITFEVSEQIRLSMGALIPSMTEVRLVGGSTQLRPTTNGRQGLNWAVAPMLGLGSTSWDMRLVAGADLSAVDTRMIRAASLDNLTLADTHNTGTISGSGAAARFVPERLLLSVLRTGAGDLELLAGGDIDIRSPFGVYTAGVNTSLGARDSGFNQPRGRYDNGSVLVTPNTDMEAALSDYQAWYPDHGGNLLISAGRSIMGDQFGYTSRLSSSLVGPYNSGDVGNWLWRQGSGSAITGANAIPTSWWINFGTYASTGPEQFGVTSVLGFVGFGALGGGNVAIRAGHDAGIVDGKGSGSPAATSQFFPRSQAIVAAVGSTGRVTDHGDLILTGGGDLTLRLGGAWNPGLAGTLQSTANGSAFQNANLNGNLINLRGSVDFESAAAGAISLRYPNAFEWTNPYFSDPLTATRAVAYGGLTITLGDATSYLNTRGDLVLGLAADPGRSAQTNSAAFSYNGTSYGHGGVSWFSLWTDRAAINLFAAGGNLSPTEAINMNGATTSDGRNVYPSILRAVAPYGSFYYGFSADNNIRPAANLAQSLLLAPSPDGQLEFLAGESIFAGKYSVNISGADSRLPTPFSPAFAGWTGSDLITPVFSNALISNGSYQAGTGYDPSGGVSATSGYKYPLFAFGPSSILNGVIGGLREPSRFYAVNGDIMNLRSGEHIVFRNSNIPWYESGGPIYIRAGRDILGVGTAPGEMISPSFGSGQTPTSTGGLIVHGNASDVSVVSAGRDIRKFNMEIAGPGALEISAGRSILQEDQGSVVSLGAIAVGDARLGASVTFMAGMANEVRWDQLRARYLDPANLADPARPLADQPGKAVKVYTSELQNWLRTQYGFEGTVAEALAYFDALVPERQRIFLRQVYYTETREAGREYNNPASSRFGSYLRGREAIATLFPDRDANGNVIDRSGDIVLFGGSGVRTNFGGHIEMMAPGGQIVLGLDGVRPPATAGLITQGQGDIRLFSEGSLLLGLSRIMTTFGGDIFAWSERGDINAGRGARTTVVYTPPKRTMDKYGNVQLAPQVPSTGAGIVTDAPIPEVPAGNIDLIAPLGTIDAGEAGIRVSGNINLAALQILNAANIQVQGTATGIPTVQAPSISAALTTSNATAASQQTATPNQGSGNERPSVIIVEVLGYGGGSDGSDSPTPDERRQRRSEVDSYDPNSAVHMLGNGKLNDEQKRRLTKEEQDRLRALANR